MAVKHYCWSAIGKISTELLAFVGNILIFCVGINLVWENTRIKVANMLPFRHAVELERALCSGELSVKHLLPVALYGVFITVAAVLCFLRQMRKQ